MSTPFKMTPIIGASIDPNCSTARRAATFVVVLEVGEGGEDVALVTVDNSAKLNCSSTPLIVG